MGSRFDSHWRNPRYDSLKRKDAFDVLGVVAAQNPVWEIDYDFVNLYVSYMLTIGANVYLALSDNTVWKRDSTGTYTQIKSGLYMAGESIPCLGNDGGTLIVDSQHEGRDKLYTLTDDGTLTVDNDTYGSIGYAGLVNNGTYLFWLRDKPHPSSSKGAVRKGTWQDNAVSEYWQGSCFIDQLFDGALPSVLKYYSGLGDYLTVNSYVGTPPQTHNFGVFNGKLYGCNNAYYGNNNLFELSTYAGGWSQISHSLLGILQGCYGYGSYLYVSGGDWSSDHVIYRWNGTTWETDSTLTGVGRVGGYHRFVMVGNTLLCCAFGRVLRKRVA